MAVTAPTFGQIRAQVAAVRKKLPEARVIGIRTPGRWTGERVKRHGENCTSSSSAIRHWPASRIARYTIKRTPGKRRRTTTVLITSLDDAELSDDILVRLAKRRLIPIDAWQIVKSLFQAHAIDPRLTRHRWIADALHGTDSRRGIPGGCRRVPRCRDGLADFTWRVIGLANDRPDLAAILRWSIDAESAARFREASPEFREAAAAWLAETAGITAGTVLACLAANQEPDALAIGLAAGVVYHATARGKLERAAGKMEERFLGGRAPTRVSSSAGAPSPRRSFAFRSRNRGSRGACSTGATKSCSRLGPRVLPT